MTARLMPYQKKRTNLKLFDEILGWLERPSTRRHLKFDMRTWVDLYRTKTKSKTIYDCATACCIGGAACLFTNPGIPAIKDIYHGGMTVADQHNAAIFDEYEAAEALGIPIEDAMLLFYPHRAGFSDYASCTDIKPKQAAKVIRHYLYTGVVDWSKA